MIGNLHEKINLESWRLRILVPKMHVEGVVSVQWYRDKEDD